MRAETQAMYAEFFRETGVAGLFPELAASVDSSRSLARAYRWFGDTMAMKRGWFDFAEDQYRTAVRLWPSWRNTARWRLSLGAKRVFLPLRLYHAAATKLRKNRRIAGD